METQSNPSDHLLYDGVPYDYAAVVSRGSILFSAGACPLDGKGNLVAPGDPATQAIAALENLRAVLSRHGAGLEHLVRTTIYVVGGHDDLVRVWEVISTALRPQRPPSTLLGVSLLGYDGQLVEIDGIAVVPA